MKRQSIFNSFYESYEDYKNNQEALLEDQSAITSLAETYGLTEENVKRIIRSGIEKKENRFKTIRKSILIGAIGTAAIVLLLFLMNIAYVKKQVTIYNKLVAQQEVCSTYFDKMFKVLKQKAQVSSEYSKNFKEIYIGIMEGRYSDGSKDQTLMKWIQESNPQFDASLYKDLMVSIEFERNAFFEEQKVLIDLNMTYNNLLESPISKHFVDRNKKYKIVIIKSESTNDAYKTGEENDINLF